MRIGIDLDNTLADYSTPIARLCREYGVCSTGLNAKLTLREHLREHGREAEWTNLQGEIYGPLMPEARLFPGAAEFLSRAMGSGSECFVVSHRTRHPIAGQAYNLHQSARLWLQGQGLGDIAVYLEESKISKLTRIGSLGPDVFIDDLPELLGDRAFPVGVRPVLFDPARSHTADWIGQACASWSELTGLLLP